MQVTPVPAEITNLQIGSSQIVPTSTLTVEILRTVYDSMGVRLQAKTQQIVSWEFGDWLLTNQYARLVSGTWPAQSNARTLSANETLVTQSLVSSTGGYAIVPRILGQGLDISGSRTITGTLTETSVYQLIIPGNSMGPEGSLRVSALWSMTNDASVKTLRLKFGNSSPLTFPGATSSVTSMNFICTIQNMGVTNSQEGHGSLASSVFTTTAALLTANIDTTVDQLLEVTLQLADVADFASLRRILVELIRP